MLKNSLLPVNYTKINSQTCGEIICENLKEFIINCKLCKIKIFVFEEFVQHFQNVHLEESSNDNITHYHSDDSGAQEQENEENCERILKLKITKTSDRKREENIKNENDEEFLWHMDNNTFSDDDKDYKENSEEPEEDVDEEQSKSIMRKSRKPKELTCEICNKMYADSRRLKLHVKIVHLREKLFKCSKCEEAFTEERLLQSHIKNKHTDYECPECHKIFSNYRYRKRHMLLHLDKREFMCSADNCGKAFVTKSQRNHHFKRCHNSEIYICEECGFNCKTQESLVVHKRHHTGEKPFACELCASRFGSKKLLKEHMACHETERKHICDVCGKSFNRPKALYHHKHLHLGVKKFVCKICGQAYAQAAGLSAHMRKHRENINNLSADDTSSNLFYNV